MLRIVLSIWDNLAPKIVTKYSNYFRVFLLYKFKGRNVPHLQIGVYILSLFLFIQWGWKDRRSPNWDEASYLLEGSDLRISMSSGIGSFIENYFLNDARSHPPLLPFLSGIFLQPNSLFNIASLLFTSIVWSFFLLAVYLVSRFFSQGRERILVLIFATFCPIVFSLGHRVLADLLLAVFTTFTVTLLLKYLHTNRNFYLVLSGFLASLSFITKPTAPIFLLGPFLCILFIGAKSPRFLIKRFLLIAFGFLFIGFSWIIPNYSNLLTYFRNQNVFPKEMYVLVPENAGSFAALLQYCLKLITLLGFPAVVFLSLGLFFKVYFLFKSKNDLFSIQRFRVNLDWLVAASVIFPPLVFFGLSKFWEFRYIIPIFPFLFLVIAKLASSSHLNKLIAVSFVPILVFSALPLSVNTDPQTWSPANQKLFYGDKARAFLTNSYFAVSRSGLEPLVDSDRSLLFLKFLKESYPAKGKEVRVLIPFSHPELNLISLTWANKYFNDKYVFQEMSFREVIGAKIVKIEDQEYQKRLSCGDLIILPTNLPIERTGYNDIVDWKNFNLTRIDYVAKFVTLKNLSYFRASKLRAVATESSVLFTIGSLDLDLESRKIYNSNYCEQFIDNAFDSSFKVLKG